MQKLPKTVESDSVVTLAAGVLSFGGTLVGEGFSRSLSATNRLWTKKEAALAGTFLFPNKKKAN